MESPFPKSASIPGEGRIVAKLTPNNVSALESMTYQYPLKLISPASAAEQGSVLVFLLSYGGGIVGGDQINLSIDVQPSARLSIVTQGHTKIFRPTQPDTVTRQNLQVEIKDGAALCLVPDPIQPFEGSVYEQIQTFKLTDDASLCLLDWVTQGRVALGENWSLDRWVGRNEVWSTSDAATSKDRLLVRDNIILDSKNRPPGSPSLRESMYGQAIMGTLILRGPMTESMGEFFLAEFAALPRIGARDFRSTEAREKDEALPQSALESWRARRLDEERDKQILWSAANVRGCIVVKFGAATVEGARNWIGSMLYQEGSIERHFGEQALMCVR
ncbi:UreD-domain-containing protein [Annulohypoxylon truncatum]|uniref:UreD-domain-containing protein n=1 Tax=Annulohypoxylon truncatum TaxID=327061 RepID=UPI0020074604|nr:UreD-domain-containing protein [Annulohypoxylon truncatum]KAI1206284.1 UreD-domain-containing protein [Annulohypoxylon truncatum]